MHCCLFRVSPTLPVGWVVLLILGKISDARGSPFYCFAHVVSCFWPTDLSLFDLACFILTRLSGEHECVCVILDCEITVNWRVERLEKVRVCLLVSVCVTWMSLNTVTILQWCIQQTIKQTLQWCSSCACLSPSLATLASWYGFGSQHQTPLKLAVRKIGLALENEGLFNDLKCH